MSLADKKKRLPAADPGQFIQRQIKRKENEQEVARHGAQQSARQKPWQTISGYPSI